MKALAYEYVADPKMNPKNTRAPYEISSYLPSVLKVLLLSFSIMAKKVHLVFLVLHGISLIQDKFCTETIIHH